MYRYKEIVWLSIWTYVVLCVTAQSKPDAPFEPMVVQLPNQAPTTTVQYVSQPVTEAPHNISIVGDEFVLDGQPLHILSGSLHYFRLPAEYWRDRLRKLKAVGLNAVSTYVEWSYHEPEERQYSFEGDRDVAQFVRVAAEEGLHVLLRPGPYICAERDLGGFPYWLLTKYPNIRLRTTDSDFMNEVKTWFNKLFAQLRPLLFGNGGPIILVQVENEYGSYSNDIQYLKQLRDVMLDHVGTNALLYTTDGYYSSMFRSGAIPSTLTTIDFGTDTQKNNMTQIFKPLRDFMPSGPLMNSEFYPGWLTHWGETQQTVSTASVVTTLRAMMEHKINVNFYMFFGGTNFEYTAGANDGISQYLPDITSYDYDAPLSEAGDPTPKYYAIRDVLEQYDPKVKEIPRPTPAPKKSYGNVTLTPRVSLFSKEGRAMFGTKHDNYTGISLPTFEALKQRASYVLYETNVDEGYDLLSIKESRDRVYTYVDDDLQGIFSRLLIKSQPLATKKGSKLSLLVENQGRINYGKMIHDFKGILSPVNYKKKNLSGPWSITGYPMETLCKTDNLTPGNWTIAQGPILYDGYFTINEDPILDTFVDPRGWGKGSIWINGHNLGRFWPDIGPQVTLYVPGVWLNKAPAQNYIQILELEKTPFNPTIKLIDHPILNGSDTTRSNLYL